MKTRNVNRRSRKSLLVCSFAAAQLLVLNSNTPVFSAPSPHRTSDLNKSVKNTVARRLAVRNMALVLATQNSDAAAVKMLLMSGADANSEGRAVLPRCFSRLATSS